MSLNEKIQDDLKTAMREKDQVRLRGIRAIRAALMLAQTEKGAKELDESKEIQLLQKLAKQRQESIDIYVQQEREDLAQKEKEELDVISGYLPEAMDEAELRKFLEDLVSELGASGMQDMGRVMGEATKRLAGRADNKSVSQILREILQ
jgi:uncharacterized protein YqeY